MTVPAARSVRRSRSGLALTKRSALCLELAVAISALFTHPPLLAQTNATTGSDDASFATRHARYAKVDWSTLPGWGDDALPEALRAFRVGCANLARRDGWSVACDAASRTIARDAASARAFFEQQFEVLQLRQPNDSDSGVLTGYFEPLLRGSRARTAGFVHAVYAIPDDLLYLDSRELAGVNRDKALFARVRERQIELIKEGEPTIRANPSQGIYQLDIGATNADLRDKKIRVRVAADRIELYPSRQEIERSGLRAARAIAWVDSAEALYTMQIQGSGKILLPDGATIRVAYAEQNGHPFLPKVSTGRSDGVRTRGLQMADGTSAVQADGAATNQANETPANATPANVQRLIDYFLSQNPRGPDFERGTVTDLPRGKSGANRVSPLAETTGKALPNEISASSRPGLTVSSAADPSYVFFRQIVDSADGPIGALGVPLTAGRSVAVDPRTTPLGAPVFIASGDGQGSSGFSRLMMAQDTGGAIRGPVRADYFWGFGRQAGARAFQTKDPLKMWVLIPKGMNLAARHREKIRTRGIDGAQADDCLIADPELCVD